MEALAWIVVIGWAFLGLWFLLEGIRFLGAATSTSHAESRGEWISSGHAYLLATCRGLAGFALIGLAVTVVLGVSVVWAAVGGPMVVLLFGLVAFGGTRVLAKRHGIAA